MVGCKGENRPAVPVGSDRRAACGLGGARADVQGMDAMPHQRLEGSVDHAVTLERRSPGECRGDQRDAKVAARPRARMPGVPRTVIQDIERDGSE